MADAVIFEPLPYRSALKDNCTDVIVLRTRPDNVSVTAKMGTMEKMIVSRLADNMYVNYNNGRQIRFFGRKQGLPEIVEWMHQQQHKLIYAEDILLLNAENRRYSSEHGHSPRLFAIALPCGIPEVKRFETSRQVIFENVRMGFAAAYDAMVEDRSLQGKGYEVAKTIWPDSILLEEPAHLKTLGDEADLPPDSETFDVKS